MQLDGHATNQDINTLIDFLCDSDDTKYSVAHKVLNINQYYEELVGKIISADNKWQWDDTNHTDLPVGTITLIEGQQDYTFSSDFLSIDSVEVLNLNGDQYEKIKQVDFKELGDLSAEQYFGTDSSGNPSTGKVSYYDLLTDDTIRLYLAPTASSNTLASGLRVKYRRTADLFTTSDTTQEPGLPSPYHSILAYSGAIPYCMKYKPERVNMYQQKVSTMEKELMRFFAGRNKDKRVIMKPKRELYL